MFLDRPGAIEFSAHLLLTRGMGEHLFPCGGCGICIRSAPHSDEKDENKKSKRTNLSGERPLRAHFQMSRATPKMRNFAKRLIAYETRGKKSSETKTPAAFPVCAKLRPHLATLLGNTGFRALLSRALALANEEVAWLRAVHVKADGSLEGPENLHAQVGPKEILEGRVVMVAQLLGLLVAFIGENLTLRLVQEIWPKVPLDDLDFGRGGQNEKTK